MITNNETAVRRVTESGSRKAVVLENGLTRVMVDDRGGMVSELSTRVQEGYLNAHWLPYFRSNSGEAFSEAKHGSFWKANLLYEIAGSFPCVPNFGPGHELDGIIMPPHGWSANEDWRQEKTGIDPQTGAAWCLSRMESPERTMPLAFGKLDAVFHGESVHYASLAIENRGEFPLEINVGWHNTIGAPFLQAGCRVSAAAERWATVPAGSEFDDTGRLAIGAEFDSLTRAPKRTGGVCDLSVVCGPIGYTDFATGAIPSEAAIGWSAVTNPVMGLVYACFFPGPSAAGSDGIALTFNDLWMQYGGRRFTPWAAYEGGDDLSFCLGTEQAVAAYANGLSYAREHKSLLGAPTTVTIPGRSTRKLRYGTLFSSYAEGCLNEGVDNIEGGDKELVLKGPHRSCRLRADPRFDKLTSLERTVGLSL